MPKQNHDAPALVAPTKTPSNPVKRNRHSRTITPRADLWDFAMKYFPLTRYRSVSRFIDAKIAQHAQLKRKELRKLGIPMPKDEVTA